MKKIYVVRHAKAEGQPFEAPLTELGVKQAELLARFFKSKQVDIIYSSPFVRTIDTIKPTANEKGLSIIEDDRLGERVLSSSLLDDWQEKLKKSFEDFDLQFEGGESHQSGMSRATSIIEEVLNSNEKNIIFVSHGNLSTLLLRYFDESYGFEHLMRMSNPDVFEITVGANKHDIKRVWDERQE